MAEGYDNRQFTGKERTRSNEEKSYDYMYSEASSLGETGADSKDLEWYQIQENDIAKQIHAGKDQDDNPNRAKCDSNECMFSVSGKIALYLCYVCNLFLCEECVLTHNQTHDFVSVESEADERKRMAELFLEKMRSVKLGRGIDYDREDVRVYGRVNVKQELDKRDCWISGLTGLGNKRWVAVDYINTCIKIFCVVSNTLLRYIQFGSEPWGITVIKAPKHSSDIYGTLRNESDKHCLLAVTVPRVKQIWFIDTNKTPAVKCKTIQMNKECYVIDFSEGKICTLCGERVESEWHHYIYILSVEGNQLQVIENASLNTPYIPDLAFYAGRVYLSDYMNNKIVCINVEEETFNSELTIERSGPRGISVDHNNCVLYVCGWRHNKVYKLSPDLSEYEPLSLETGYTESPYRLYFLNNKVYISHRRPPSVSNVVTVVQIQT